MDTEVLQSILDASAALIVALDRSGRVVHFNRACERLSGYSFSEVKDRAIWDLVLVPEEADRVKSAFEELTAGLSGNQHENHWVTRDGARRLIAWSNNVLLDGDGAVEYIVATGVDITEQRRSEANLRQSQKMEAVCTLSSGVAHDFNNLLTVVAGYNHMVLDALPEDGPARSAAEEVAKATERATELTSQLLAFSRRPNAQPKVLDLNQVVGKSNKALRRLIGEKIELSTDLAAGLDRIKADPKGLDQVIMNLAVNSREAMPNGGKLVIKTVNAEADQVHALGATPEAQSYVLLAVSDNGCGMDPATQSHMFEPFFTTKEPGRGAGLGLATVYAIVVQSGGHIAVDSVQGEGTTVRIYFPAVEAAGESEEQKGDTKRSLRGTETILLVEDDPGVRGLVRVTLGQYGYSVLEASNGWEALQLQEQHQGPIHLLIADIVVPQMNGQELAARLSLLRPDIRVLYMSGYTDKSIILEGVLSSGIAFIKKPFTPEALAAKVREVLDSHKTTHA